MEYKQLVEQSFEAFWNEHIRPPEVNFHVIKNWEMLKHLHPDIYAVHHCLNVKTLHQICIPENLRREDHDRSVVNRSQLWSYDDLLQANDKMGKSSYYT